MPGSVLTSNPNKKRILKLLLMPLLENYKITKDDDDHLKPTSSNTTPIYVTPKTHKKDIPLRSIVTGIG